jgi:hypothetical protein
MNAAKIKSIELALTKETDFLRRQVLLKELWRLEHAQSRALTQVKIAAQKRMAATVR